jgi:hypothetical protein
MENHRDAGCRKGVDARYFQTLNKSLDESYSLFVH